MPRIVHFEMPADNLDRAQSFYETVFGWKFEKWDGPYDYRLIRTGPSDERGINGALISRDAVATTVNTISVHSLDEYLAKVVAAGGMVEPKMEIPGAGWFAYAMDTEGSRIGIIEPSSTPPLQESKA